MSKRTIRKSLHISRRNMSRDTSLFPDNPSCLRRLRISMSTVLAANTITDRYSILQLLDSAQHHIQRV